MFGVCTSNFIRLRLPDPLTQPSKTAQSLALNCSVRKTTLDWSRAALIVMLGKATGVEAGRREIWKAQSVAAASRADSPSPIGRAWVVFIIWEVGGGSVEGLPLMSSKAM